MMLVNPWAFLILLTIMLLTMSIFIVSSKFGGVEQDITGIRDINTGLNVILRYLDSDVEFNDENISMSELIKLHCNSAIFNEVKKNTNYLNLFFPNVISVTCPGMDEEVIRGPLCTNTKEIIYLKDSKDEIKIKYCSRPDSSDILSTPDGKEWKILDESRLDVLWREAGRENSQNETDLKAFYAKYSEPEQVGERKSDFEGMVRNAKKGVEITTATKENWRKVSEGLWCLTATANRLALSCESFFIDEEDLIECEGIFDGCEEFFKGGFGI